MPVDLSEILFIATANDLSEVSRPLLDRMEIIEVSSYTKNEKLHIAKEHLVAKQLKKNGLTKKLVRFTDKALAKIIDGYTMEAGVRELERMIAAVLRKVVRKNYTVGGVNIEKQIVITDKNLSEYLGKVKFIKEKASRKNEVGIVRGLAWTAAGGDTLEIEVNVLGGKPELILTGNMGDVMRESAQIALSYVRSVVRKNQIFEENAIHIHIPEGAVPKDGPSAGITMATAIYSAVTGKPVDASTAMTGEVTLRGRVMPIGGLKEKLLAAKTAGLKRVLVPLENKSDVEELEEEIVHGLEIVYVSDMKEVLKLAIVK
jgi:ATP-dependent Lon protease